MKKLKKTLLIVFSISSVFILVSLMIIFPIILKTKWFFPFTLPLILISTAWMIYGLIELIRIWNKKTPEIDKIKTTEAVAFHILRVTRDKDNGDNLIIKERVLGRFGEQGTTPTPVLLLICKGEVKKQKRAILINLNNYKEEFSEVSNPSEQKIERLKKIISENPPDDRFEESELLTNWGVQKTRKPYMPSSQKERDKLNEQKAIEESAV